VDLPVGWVEAHRLAKFGPSALEVPCPFQSQPEFVVSARQLWIQAAGRIQLFNRTGRIFFSSQQLAVHDVSLGAAWIRL
jgi:hypothetical protein